MPQRDSLFWSPDSRQLVRGTAAGAQVFDVSAGATRPLCDCRLSAEAGIVTGRSCLVPLGTHGDGNLAPVGERSHSGGGHDGRCVARANRTPGRCSCRTDAGFSSRARLQAEQSPRMSARSMVARRSGSPTARERIFVPAAGGRGAVPARDRRHGPRRAAVRSGHDERHRRRRRPWLPGRSRRRRRRTASWPRAPPGSRPRTIPTWFDRKGTSLGQRWRGGAHRSGRAVSRWAEAGRVRSERGTGSAGPERHLAARPRERRAHAAHVQPRQHTRVVP